MANRTHCSADLQPLVGKVNRLSGINTIKLSGVPGSMPVLRTINSFDLLTSPEVALWVHNSLWKSLGQIRFRILDVGEMIE